MQTHFTASLPALTLLLLLIPGFQSKFYGDDEPLLNPHFWYDPANSPPEGGRLLPFEGCSSPQINLLVAEPASSAAMAREGANEAQGARGSEVEMPNPIGEQGMGGTATASNSEEDRGESEARVDTRAAASKDDSSLSREEEGDHEASPAPSGSFSSPEAAARDGEEMRTSDREAAGAAARVQSPFISSKDSPAQNRASTSGGQLGSRGEALSQREARLMEEAKKTEVIVAESKFVVSLDNLRQYLGRPKFGKERWYSETPVGVVMGLVTTQAGGQIAYIESR
jgi:hypothetical protein